MKLKQRLTSMLMALTMLAVSAVGYVSAAGEEIVPQGDSGEVTVTYSYELDPPKGGTPVYGVGREKVATGSANNSVNKITNNTSYPLYLNVRNSSGTSIVGNEKSITSTGSYRITYKSGYGTVGEVYRPSVQTDQDASSGAYISGYWHP